MSTGTAARVEIQRPERKERPAHHADDKETRFQNPWSSFRYQKPSHWMSAFWMHATSSPKASNDLTTLIPSRTPDWGAGAAPEGLKATWLGHACYLVEFPTPEGAARGARLLFDPVLSHRCSPSQWVGPARLLPTPCPAEDIPAVDAICISHNHYDHMDAPTLLTVFKKHKPHIFAPLGNLQHFVELGIPKSHIHLLDWWDVGTVSLSLPGKYDAADPSGAGVPMSFAVTCTPAQHTANRSLFDRWRTLWASWAAREVLPSDSARTPRSVYFAGDTGYRTVWDGEDEDVVPRCPAFKEIGEKLGPFDLALLPIGAYAPRAMWSNLHSSPADAVEIFKDIRAKRALAMHWGTWTLTTEPTMEPPQLLKEASAKAGLGEGAFTVCGLGETTVV